MLDIQMLTAFEERLDPTHIEKSPIPGMVLGYGEISTVFQIGKDGTKAYKRMPLFSTRYEAEKYLELYRTYCDHLKKTGLNLPSDDSAVIELPGRPVTLYIIQEQFKKDQFLHQKIRNATFSEVNPMISEVISNMDKVWQYNIDKFPQVTVALDGQLSNWVKDEQNRLVYIDTSTPLLRLNGVEQLDPELFLQSTPVFLRWIIRALFLKDVMNRYYDQRQVTVDLVANLFKEQRSDLVPDIIELVNRSMKEKISPLKVDEVKKYYNLDKTIWTMFLSFRKVDRLLKTKLLRKRYEFILP